MGELSEPIRTQMALSVDIVRSLWTAHVEVIDFVLGDVVNGDAQGTKTLTLGWVSEFLKVMSEDAAFRFANFAPP